MADFDASKLNISLENGIADSVPIVEIFLATSSPGPTPVSGTYIMRGWRPGILEYEYWKAIGTPNASNPSGQPIIDITVQSRKS